MANSDFVAQFYNIEGDLVAQRKKNFFKLLKAQRVPLTEDDLKSLCPRTHLERQFQIDIFIHFKMSSKLLDVIKEGNELFISKILKHPSLLLEIIGNVSPEIFVDDFLPFTSYATRMKILKKISFVLSEPQMDEIISSVHKRYGFTIATKLVHTCSSKKIKDFLFNHEVILKPRQVKFIFDKDPQLFLFYLSYYKTLTENAYDHRSFCRYVALKDPQMWFKLQKEGTIFKTNLGRRTSKNFLRHSDDDFLNNVKYYSDFLKLDVIVRKLHGNFKEVYFEFFPRDTYNINTHDFSNTLLQHYPKKKQWDMFTQTYLKVFENNILDNLIYLNSYFIKLLPNKSIINKWAEVHYNKYKSNDILKYCDPNKAIPLIKEKINVTSDIYERKALIMLLLQNCEKNRDLASLEEVLKYICFRHRNDDNTSQILDKIRYLFKLEELNETHWNHILEMITVLKLRQQMDYSSIVFFPKYIEYLILHGKPFGKTLTTYIKDVEANGSSFRIELKNPEVEKYILTEIINVYRDVVETDDITFNEKFINISIDFNEKNSKHNINLSDFPGFVIYMKSLLDTRFQELQDSARNLLIRIVNYNFKFPEKPIIIIEEAQILEIFRQNNKENFSFDTIVEKSIKKTDRSKFENEVLAFFWDHLLENSKNFEFRRRIIQWIFLHEPKTIIPHFDRIWTLNQSYINIKDIKLLSHLGFDNKIVDYCTSKLVYLDEFLEEATERKSSSSSNVEVDNEPKKEIDRDIYKNVIKYLSTLLTTNEYIDIISKRFIPVKAKVDIADEGLNQIYFLQCEVAGSLKKMLQPALVLPTVMKFCLGDYLQSALPSLYSICYRTPEKLLYPYMEVLSKKAMSARKHSLFLSCELLSYNYVLNRLQNVNDDPVSGQKHIFSAMLKYFRKNPCQELLNLVTTDLTKIEKYGEETLNSLNKTDMPEKFKSEYIQKCWYFFESLRKKEINVQTYLQSFFNTIVTPKYIIMFPADFCKHIITHYFKDPAENDHKLNSINRFVCLILRNERSEQNFNFIFDIISSFKTPAAKQFFNTFYDIAVDDIKHNNKIDTVNNYYIELFKQHWFSTFTPIKMFNEHVLLNLLYLKCKPSPNLIENYARGVVTYLEELIAEYGPFIYYKIKDLVLHKHTFTEKEKYLFLYNILTVKNSTVNCMLVLDLLKSQSYNDEIKDIRHKIMEILKQSDQLVVSVYFNSYFG